MGDKIRIYNPNASRNHQRRRPFVTNVVPNGKRTPVRKVNRNGRTLS